MADDFATGGHVMSTNMADDLLMQKETNMADDLASGYHVISTNMADDLHFISKKMAVDLLMQNVNKH